MAMNILKNEGLLGLYAGVTPAVARHIPYTGFRAIGYEYIRAFFCGSAPKDQAPLPAKMAAGMSAGAIGQAIAVPCDLIKVQRYRGDLREIYGRCREIAVRCDLIKVHAERRPPRAG